MSQHEVVHEADSLRAASVTLSPDPRTNPRETLAHQQQLVAQYNLLGSVPYAVRVHFETAKNLYLYSWFVYRFYPVAEKHALATLEFALRERLALLYPGQYGPNAKWIPGLSKLLSTARDEKLISNQGLRAYHRWAKKRARVRVSDEATRKLIESGAGLVEFDPDSAVPEEQDYTLDALAIFIETLPGIRNMYAHGSSALHSMVWGTFEIVTDLVNELFAHKESGLSQEVS